MEVINDTIDPEGAEPRILKAIPLHPLAKTEPAPAHSNKPAKTTAPPVRQGNYPVRKGRKD